MEAKRFTQLRMHPILEVELNGADLWVLDHVWLSIVGGDCCGDSETVLIRKSREDAKVVLLFSLHDLEVVQRKKNDRAVAGVGDHQNEGAQAEAHPTEGAILLLIVWQQEQERCSVEIQTERLLLN